MTRYECHYCNRSTPISVTCCEGDAYEAESAARFFAREEAE